MYLPALPQIAKDFGTTVAQVSLSLSSYFIGLSFGQLFYGPLLDRYGRKKPLFVGLFIYILASLGCLLSHSSDSLVAWRFVQAIGGCAAGVASMAMVRDLFTTQESGQVFSLLILVLGVSPLLAPTTGGYLATAFGWQAVFMLLALIALLLFAAIWFLLPETHEADHSVSLAVMPNLRGFAEIMKNPSFSTYVLAGAIAFSGLFVYLPGSTVIFMGNFGVSGKTFGWIFATIAAGFVGTSQVNVLLLKRFTSEQILLAAFIGQVAISAAALLGCYFDVLGLGGTVFMLFLFLSCFGLTNPNAFALALAPFSKNAGRASALMGFLQMGIGALASMTVGIFGLHETLHIIAIMAACSVGAFLILLYGRGASDIIVSELICFASSYVLTTALRSAIRLNQRSRFENSLRSWDCALKGTIHG
jgi:DHA1 family bicyclomycin/chloramphenicol resistance-like MFS transporter